MNNKDHRYFYFATVFDKMILGVEDYTDTIEMLEEAENYEACKGIQDAEKDIEEGLYNDLLTFKVELNKEQ